MTHPASDATSGRSTRWQRFTSACVRGFHAYASWLVSISWKRFFLLAVLLMVAAGILQDLPPFRWTYSETVSVPAKSWPSEPTARKREPLIHIEKDRGGGKDGIEISIDERGVRIRPRAAASTPPAASAPEAASGAGTTATGPTTPGVDIRLPPGATSETVREAVEEARAAIEEMVRDAKQEVDEARRDSQAAAADVPRTRKRTVRFGEALPEFAMLWILASIIIKVTYKRQILAEAQAAQAVETAESESLKRQVVEARMAAMQAQIEPHFLFNTLASIDHLIEIDPKRAGTMLQHLIALLRASMPTMREAGDGGPRELGRELAVVRPYLEILKVRMEERLTTTIDVPAGLESAEFPAMMIQTLVENAVKHGLEPKPEGGHLSIKAEIVHGKLAVAVTDTGLGLGVVGTAGTGVGLANVRERLRLLYGTKAALTLTENPGGGTIATINVPYKPLQGDAA